MTDAPAYLFLHNASYVPDDNDSAYDEVNWTQLDPGGGGGGVGPPFAPPTDIVKLQTFVRGLQLYVAPVLSICGILGNVLSLLCLSLSPCRPSGRCFATALLSAETLQLLTLLHTWTTEMGLDLYTPITGWCHLVTFLAEASKFLSTWYLVCLLVNCFLTNSFPDRDCCTQWRHLVLTVALAILALVVYLNISLTATLFYVSDHPICLHIREEGSALLYLDHVDAVVNVLLPLLVNSIFGVGLCLLKWCCIERSSRDSDAQLICHRYIITHTVLWMPFQVARLHNAITVMSSGGQPGSLKGFLWQEIFKYLSYFNMTISIFVLIIVNSLFRKQLKEKFTEVLCKISCCCCLTNGLNGSYLRYASAAVQTSFIESNVRTNEIT